MGPIIWVLVSGSWHPGPGIRVPDDLIWHPGPGLRVPGPMPRSNLVFMHLDFWDPDPGTWDPDCGLAQIFLLNQDFDHFFILIYREVALNMERKDSKKVKKKEIPRVLNKDSKGLNRRNSTSVSSIKRKESGPKSKLFEETEGSFDTDPIESPMEEEMNQTVPGTSV